MPSHDPNNPRTYLHPGHGHSTPPPSKRDDMTCPQGASYYICSGSGFKGCCNTDPCVNGTTRHCLDSNGHPSLSYAHPPSYWPDWTSPSAVTAATMGTETAGHTTTVTMTLSSVTAPDGGGATVAGTVTSTLDSGRSSGSMIGSASAFASSDTTAISHPTGTAHASSIGTGVTNPFLSLSHSSISPSKSPSPSNNTASHANRSTTSGSTITGIALGTAGAIALLLLICCICLRRRKKKQNGAWNFTLFNKTTTSSSTSTEENKELKAQLEEAAAVQAERNKALRALENRRTGEGVWVQSPGLRSKFST